MQPPAAAQNKPPAEPLKTAVNYFLRVYTELKYTAVKLTLGYKTRTRNRTYKACEDTMQPYKQTSKKAD